MSICRQEQEVDVGFDRLTFFILFYFSISKPVDILFSCGSFLYFFFHILF